MDALILINYVSMKAPTPTPNTYGKKINVVDVIQFKTVVSLIIDHIYASFGDTAWLMRLWPKKGAD